jgi:hypothetical protein
MARKLPVDLHAVPSSERLTSEDVLALERAAYHDFREPVTAYLTSAYFVDGLCLGIVWGHDRDDETGRFADGHRVHTSKIVTIEKDGDFPVVVTLNSRYVLISLHATYSPGTSVH